MMLNFDHLSIEQIDAELEKFRKYDQFGGIKNPLLANTGRQIVKALKETRERKLNGLPGRSKTSE
jgi:hypothetical protein